MNNSEVARIFQDVADMLEMKGESPFKIRAYQKAARSVDHLPVGLEELVREGKLSDVSGIGDALSKKITELVTTGRLQYYENLKSEFPEGLGDILNIPGVGPKTAMRLVQELGIGSTDELEAAIIEGKVTSMSGLGEKTAENILLHIQSMRTRDHRIPIDVALCMVDEIVSQLSECPALWDLCPAGSVRRFKETVRNIDLIGTSEDMEEVLDVFVHLPQVRQVLASGADKASVVADPGVQVDLWLVEHGMFGSCLQHFTGSEEHNIAIRERGHRHELEITEYGITDLRTGELKHFPSEQGFYSALGLQFIPPELREGQSEIERAEQGTLPDLVKVSDIRGDLHVHTDWSDGRCSIEEIASAARDLGYQYLAITEHSVGRGIAHGLDEERLRRQIQEIRQLNERGMGIYIFSGIEVDIRADGSLDLPDEVLSELDIVVAAVHSAMGQDQVRMTRRILRALENPNVDVLAHPSCRLLGEREPVAADWDAIFEAATRTNTLLEINAIPQRLDLRDFHVLRAKELGAKFVIDTDSHSPDHLGLIKFGVSVARRGWCEAEHIFNTRPLEEVKGFLRRAER